ncbi:MAG: hypothetical protein WDN66_04635 [Candidatus Saccharibacteria bacterium]
MTGNPNITINGSGTYSTTGGSATIIPMITVQNGTGGLVNIGGSLTFNLNNYGTFDLIGATSISLAG